MQNATLTHESTETRQPRLAWPESRALPWRAAQSPTARLLLACLVACALALGSVPFGPVGPSSAFAETTDIEAEPDELQLQIQQTATAYDEATARVAQLEQQIADNESRIAQLETDLPEQQKRGAGAMRALYKLQQESHGLVNIILEADSLNDFLALFEYIDHIQQRNVSEIESLQSMKTELDTAQAQLAEAKDTAVAEQANAQSALAAAQNAREEAQRKAEEQARQEAAALAAEQAEAEQRKQAEEQAAADAKAQEPSPSEGEPDSNQVETPQTPETPDPPASDVDWSSDKAAFVAEWTGRIDAYLAGSPLSGQGATFAEAAWNYGVDPRWSPAISNTESSKGASCFYPYNAWGWGNISWGSWEEAIDAHVRGLANGYGYTISVAAAQKYAQSWEHWYDATLAQMNMI